MKRQNKEISLILLSSLSLISGCTVTKVRPCAPEIPPLGTDIYIRIQPDNLIATNYEGEQLLREYAAIRQALKVCHGND